MFGVCFLGSNHTSKPKVFGNLWLCFDLSLHHRFASEQIMALPLPAYKLLVSYRRLVSRRWEKTHAKKTREIPIASFVFLVFCERPKGNKTRFPQGIAKLNSLLWTVEFLIAPLWTPYKSPPRRSVPHDIGDIG